MPVGVAQVILPAVEIGDSLGRHIPEQGRLAERLELLAQIAEHEGHQLFRVVAVLLGACLLAHDLAQR